MSDTPRTDEEAVPYPVLEGVEAPFDWVPAEFAKVLERELAAARAENEKLRNALAVLMRDAAAVCNDTIELEPALFQARAALDAVRKPTSTFLREGDTFTEIKP